MRYLTDIFFFIGLALVGAGVYLAFGLPWALMVAGAALMALGTLMARGAK